MGFFDFQKQPSVPVPTQPQESKARLGTLAQQDRQLAFINKAEAAYKATGDLNALIKFWEHLLATDGILFNGVGWPFRIVELYYKVKRYDDVWRELNKLVLNPLLTKKARQWQIKVLKKEKKDYSHIQQLLDNGQ